jgi:hypothetical protein
MKIFQSPPATEWRTKVAHGETVGFNSKMDKAPDGAKETVRGLILCRPCRGLSRLFFLPTVKPWATFLRASGALVAMILFLAVGARAETTNDLSDAEIQGRQLAQKLLEQRPTTNFIQIGILNIRNVKGVVTNLSFKSEITVYAEHWDNHYVVSLIGGGTEGFAIVHGNNSTNNYVGYKCFGGGWDGACDQGQILSVSENTPFGDSDFLVFDLGLEFFHWPEQKVLKKEVHRSCGCTVLESINPNPSANGYSHVVSWIDNDSLGIVEAYAYDARGKLLKDFYPKDIKKVDGQWQVQTLVMENVQTGSRTRLEFDLKK